MYIATIALGVLINSYCYGTSEVRIIRDFFFNLRKKLDSLSCRFLQVSYRYELEYMIGLQLNRRLSVWQKPKDFFHQIFSFSWTAHNKRLPGQSIKPWPTRTIRNQNRYLKLGNVRSVVPLWYANLLIFSSVQWTPFGLSAIWTNCATGGRS